MHAAAHTMDLGFGPAEVLSLVNRRVVEEHAGECGFLWTQRQRAAGAPHYALVHLQRLDERVRAHLQALGVAGDAGWRAAREVLDPADTGSVFTAGCVAFDSGVPDRMRHVLAVALTSPACSDAIAAAIAWLRPEAVRDVLPRLGASPVAVLRAVACRVLNEGRAHDVEGLERLLADPEPAVRALALRGVGEMGCGDLASTTRQALDDEHPGCRFWAAWTLALMGDTGSARRACAWGLGTPVAREAVEIGMRCGDTGWARETVRALSADPATRRLAVVGAGALGDAVTVPWLIDQCDDPTLAPVAGEAITLVTGADLRYLDLDATPGDDAPPRVGEDDALPLPDTARLRAWWRGEAQRFGSGTRWLAGRPLSAEGVHAVLRDGLQRQRAAAAVERVRLGLGPELFPVRARADRQRRRLPP